MSSTYESRLARADVLVWLDLPVGLRLWRVTKRLFRYLGQARPDLPKGCVERLHPETVAFYRFIWTNRRPARAKVAQLIEDGNDGFKVVHLRSAKDVRRGVDSLSAG